jgi:hypothetical protein
MEARITPSGNPSDLEGIKKQRWFSITALYRLFIDSGLVLVPEWEAKIDLGASFLMTFFNTEKRCQNEVTRDSTRGAVGPQKHVPVIVTVAVTVTVTAPETDMENR